MEQRAIQAKLPESALKWDPFRMQCQGRSVRKKSSDSVKFGFLNDRKLPVMRAALNGDRKLGSSALQKSFVEQYPLDGERRAHSHVARDVKAKAGMSDTGQSAPQGRPFKEIFEEVLGKQGIHLSADQQEQILSINSDTSVLMVPAEWRKPFLIARGLACEGTRIKGLTIQEKMSSNDLQTLTLFHNTSDAKFYEIPKDILLPAVADMFKKDHNQEVIVITTIREQDYDSLFTYMEAYQNINLQKSQENQAPYELQKYQYEQNLWEMQEFRQAQRKKELQQALFLQILDKSQKTQFLREIERGKLSQEGFGMLKKMQDNVKDIITRTIQETTKEHEEHFLLKKEMLQKSKELYDAYYMMLGTPEVRSIVEKLPKGYTINSMTLEKRPVTDEALKDEKRTLDISLGSLLKNHYEVRLSINRVDSADKPHKAEE